MHQVVSFFTLLGLLFLLLDAHVHSSPPLTTFPPKIFGGLLIENRPISLFQCFKDEGGGSSINTTDFTKGTRMLATYCKNYKIASRSPYVAIVGSTTAYVCSEVGPEICRGETMDVVHELLTEKCGEGAAGHVRLGMGDTNRTTYGRGRIGLPMCRGLGTGRMRKYQFNPIPVYINGSRLES
ncbi:hypothetical protein E4U13_000631 [Claviceps humidiphila]|uniref:Ecp2 effector protein domain-containing protein n=1 Tax=Claviceps humidiphila TaxID=1294629 RepID=A0A9P7Q1E3_9HYPO|nr:hypothetical protein E4U13_000631 [Claviceps humidiphila]